MNDKFNRSILVFCVIFSALAHAFRWFNADFCHDSLLVYQNDGIWQLFLGRWFVPFWLFVRGKIASPWLIAILSVLFLSVAIVLLTYLFGLRKRALAIPLCAVISSCPVITCLYSTFISATDIHMIAFFFSVLSVLMLSHLKHGWLYGGIVLAFSMALYQTYVEVAIVLIIFLVIKMLVIGDEAIDIRKFIFRSICYLSFGGLFYFIVWRSYIWCLGYNLSTLPSVGSYNSLTGMSELLHANLWVLAFKAYKKAMRYVLLPNTLHYYYIGVANLLLAVLGLSRAAVSTRTWPRRLLCLTLVLSLPLAANFVYILSRGMIHTLMLFPIVMFYVGVLMTCSFRITPNFQRFDRISRYSIVAVVAIVSFNYTVYANQFHLQKHLEEQATLSVMTRVVDRIERFDGYKSGDKVVLVGVLNTSSISPRRPGFEKNTNNVIRSRPGFSVTYMETYQNYFNEILAYPIVIAGREEAYEYSRMQEVIQMPSFPSEGCIKRIGDDIVVKLSNEIMQKYYEF